jgi:DnaK suppressor protein
MQPTELERSKAVLRTLLYEMEQPVRNRDDIAVENAPDTMDQIQGATERDLAIRQIESGFNRLQSVRSALQRIEDGTYGICARCDCEISSKRLMAIPWASHCVKCQDIADRESNGHGSQELVRAF